MIGRADIEGSKSNVAMCAWLPQVSSLLPTSSTYFHVESMVSTNQMSGILMLTSLLMGVARTLSSEEPMSWRALNCLDIILSQLLVVSI